MNTETAAKIISRMTFSAADYVKGKGPILAEAAKLYKLKTRDDSPEIEEQLVLLLSRSFAERKALSVTNSALPEHLKDGSLFRICVDETVVEGQVRLSPKKISVEIVSPYQGHQAGAELQMLAPVIWTERPEMESEANEQGREKAISLLTDIYYSLL